MTDQPDADLMAPEAAALDPIAASPLNRLAHPAAYPPGRGGDAAAQLDDKDRARLAVLRDNLTALAQAARHNQLPAYIVSRVDEARAAVGLALSPPEAGEAAAPAPVPARLYVVLDGHGRPIKGPYVNEAEAEYWAYIKGCPSPCTLGFFDVPITPDPRPPISR